MSLFYLYLLFVVLPGIHEAFRFLVVTFAFTCLFSVVAKLNESAMNGESKKINNRILKITPIAAFISLAIFSVTPSRDDIYLLSGAYAVTSNAEIQKLPDNVLKAANRYLEKIAGEENQKEKKWQADQQ